MFRAHDNGRLASGGADRAVILTDVGTGQHIRTYRGHLSVSSSSVLCKVISGDTTRCNNYRDVELREGKGSPLKHAIDS